jgi:hypothetical protein
MFHLSEYPDPDKPEPKTGTKASLAKPQRKSLSNFDGFVKSSFPFVGIVSSHKTLKKDSDKPE